MVLVGGQGILSRHFGLTIDYVSGVELVDHSGKIIYATKDNEYADLYWLARGGGSGVQHYPGIITAVEFDKLPALEVEKTQKVYTSFKIEYANPTPQMAEQLLKNWQDFYLDETMSNDELFDRLTVEPWLWHDKIPKLYLSCYFYGNDNLHQQMMERIAPKLMKFLDGGKMSRVERYDALAFTRMLAGVKNNAQLSSGRHGWDLRETHFGGNRWKGYSAVASKRVKGEAFRTLAKSIFYAEPLSRRYVEFKPLQGAIRRQSQNNETAFGHRQAIWWSLSSHWHWSTDSAKVVDAIQESSAKGHEEYVRQMNDSYIGGYAGYIDHGNSTGQDLERYYGSNAARIAAIKKRRDPYNLFRLYLPNDVSNAPFHIKQISEESS